MDRDDEIQQVAALTEILGSLGLQLASLQTALAETRGHLEAGREAATAELRGARLMGERLRSMRDGVTDR